MRTCARCGATAGVALTRPWGLPRGWEFYEPSKGLGPEALVWCGECVDRMLADLERAMLTAAKAGRW